MTSFLRAVRGKVAPAHGLWSKWQARWSKAGRGMRYGGNRIAGWSVDYTDGRGFLPRRKRSQDMSDTGDIRNQSDSKSDATDHLPTPDEKLDKELDDSMDASDPPSSTHPDDHGEPAPSSGYKADEE